MLEHLDIHNFLNFQATTWAADIGRACWQGGLALSLAYLLCRLPRLPGRVQCWIWRLAYLKLLLALCWAHPIDLPLLPPAATPVTLELHGADPFAQNVRVDPLSLPFTAGIAATQPDLSLLWRTLCCVWLAGGLWYVWRAVRDWRDISRLRASCSALNHPQTLALCEELCAQYGLRRCPALLLQTGMGYPQLVGMFRPAIILPELFWGACTSAQRRMILAHELAHIRRHDLLWAWVPLLGRGLFFFFPPVWLAEREWQQAQEIACDEQALRLEGASRAEYGNVLLKIALLPQPELTPGLMAMRIAGSYSVVQRRLLAMKHAGTEPRRTLVVAGALLLTVGVTGLIPWHVSAQDSPQEAKEKAERSANKEAMRMKLSAGDVGLSKEVAEQLQLNLTQEKQAKDLAMVGAKQVMNELTPEQRQRIVPTGLNDALSSLDLTEAQQVKIKTLMISHEKLMQALKTDQNVTPEQREDEMKRLKLEDEAQWSKILTPQQQAQLRERLEQHQSDENPLHLTDAQKASMGTLKRNLATKMEAISADTTLSDAARASGKEAALRELKERYQQILTPEQRQISAQYEQQQQANRERGPFHLVNLEPVANLTQEQRLRIQTIYDTVERQFVQTLSPAQKQRLQQIMQKVASRKP